MVGWEGLYEVSSFGNVNSLDRLVTYENNGSRRLFPGKKSIQHPGRADYLVCDFKERERRQHATVHSVVMEAFVGQRPEGYDICHNDGNRHNNRIENLRYGTRQSNILDTVNHGRHHSASKDVCALFGHPLEGANLRPRVPSDKGTHRRCVSCSKAQNCIRQNPDLAENLREVSWVYYERAQRGAGNFRPFEIYEELRSMGIDV